MSRILGAVHYVPKDMASSSYQILLLKNIHERLNSNGLLVLTSTYDWESNNIKREHWPGGFKKDGEPVTSFEGIKNILSDHFELIKTPFDLLKISKHSSRTIVTKKCELSFWRLKK